MPTRIKKNKSQMKKKSPLKQIGPAAIFGLGAKKREGQFAQLGDFFQRQAAEKGVELDPNRNFYQQGMDIIRSDAFRDQSILEQAKDIGGGIGEFFVGGLEGVTGQQFINKQQQGTPNPTYTTNIDPMTGEEMPLPPVAMHGKVKPTKILIEIDSKPAKNMSKRQYDEEMKMKNIASDMDSKIMLKGDQYKIDANKDGKISEEDFKLLNKK
jgi:hypothetical protein